ncbi:IS200/IS605 family transposase [Moraxella sp. ZJ142]|uniref:IS200/IS605 family transposase n=1 Tax=Moraxella marmotae TaxID=3344520 RepID=UPI0035D4954A
MKNKPHFRCHYQIILHLLILTKNSQHCLNNAMQNSIKTTLSELCQKCEVEVIDIGATSNYASLTFSFSPAANVTEFVRTIKTVTGRLLRKEYAKELAKFYGNTPAVWARGYCLVSKEADVENIVAGYLNNRFDNA